MATDLGEGEMRQQEDPSRGTGKVARESDA